MGDSVVCVSDESSAHCTHIFASCHLFLLPYAKSLIHLCRFVREENKGQRMLLGKLRMACGGILADSDNGIALVADLLVKIAD